MAERTVRSLPTSTIHVKHEGRGRLRAQPWEVAWDEADLDRDGHPGATVHVESSLCGGELRVASSAVSTAEGTMRDGSFSGVVAVETTQRILDATGFCLSAAAEDKTESQGGTFAYVPVAASATCDSLMAAGWPVRSEAPER
jgi:hypothetical protein